MLTKFSAAISIGVIGVAAGWAGACGGPDEPIRYRIEQVRTLPSAPASPDGAMPDRTGETGPARVPPNLGSTLPAGWRRTEARPMRLINLAVEDRPKLEVYVAVLPGAAGGRTANFNRWRRQMGRDPLSETQLRRLPRVSLLGDEVPLLEARGVFRNMRGDVREDYALLGVVRPLAGWTVFVKMLGPAEAVRAERERFIEFCESLNISDRPGVSS